MKKQFGLFAATAFCVAVITLTSCSKGVTHDAAPATDTSRPNAKVTSSPAAPASPSAKTRAPGGDPIDTTALDTDVIKAEDGLKAAGPDDDAVRVALAHAYLARANALTGARQYSSALGDYRRVLKYDPHNKEALDMSSTIISIFKSMDREPPAEGKEPKPLPMTDNKAGV